MRLKSQKLLLVAGACLLLTACGGDDADENAAPVEKGVVTSALECADLYSIDIEKCQNAIRAAITSHESTAAKYNRLHKCEAAEGAQRCERAGQKDFSKRLQAFLLAITDPPEAAPLYPTTDQKAGFLRDNGDAILLDQDEIKFSDQAAAVAEGNAALPEKAIQGGF